MPKGGLGKPAKASLDGILYWLAQAVELDYLSQSDHEAFLNSILDIQKEIYGAEHRYKKTILKKNITNKKKIEPKTAFKSTTTPSPFSRLLENRVFYFEYF